MDLEAVIGGPFGLAILFGRFRGCTSNKELLARLSVDGKSRASRLFKRACPRPCLPTNCSIRQEPTALAPHHVRSVQTRLGTPIPTSRTASKAGSTLPRSRIRPLARLQSHRRGLPPSDFRP